jgi:anti-sigma-K factor RskA
MTEPTYPPSTGCPYELWDGSYVLGSLSPADRREFEAHLDGCRTCSRSLRDLAGLPGLLGRIGPEVFEESEPEPVPETLLPRLSRAVRREQRRRTWLASGIAAAAAVAITVGGVLVFDRPSSEPTAEPSTPVASTAPARQMVPVVHDVMKASVALTPVAWGTRIDLTCSYPHQHGHEKGGSYALVVHTTDGRLHRVATWWSLPGKVMHLPASVAASASQISKVEVTWTDGEPVLELSL